MATLLFDAEFTRIFEFRKVGASSLPEQGTK